MRCLSPGSCCYRPGRLADSEESCGTPRLVMLPPWCLHWWLVTLRVPTTLSQLGHCLCTGRALRPAEQGNPITKQHTQYALTDNWILAQKPGIAKIQFIDQRKLKKKEDQNMDTLVLLRRENKIPMGGDKETKCGAEIEGRAIHRLPHLGIHPIYSSKPKHYCKCQQALADRSLI